MDKWEESATKAWKAILERVNYLNKTERIPMETLAQRLGFKNKGSVSLWLSGDRKAENTPFPKMLRYLESLGLDYQDYLPAPQTSIRRASRNSPTEIVEGNELPKVPVVGEVGAGNEVDVFSSTPEMFLSILPRYYRKDMICMKVAGDSMAPTIGKGDYVGIVPFDGTLHEGGIYLVELPPFGRVVKRVRMGSSGEIILLSDNPSYGERIIPFEGYEQMIQGQVYWIMQKVWED